MRIRAFLLILLFFGVQVRISESSRLPIPKRKAGRTTRVDRRSVSTARYTGDTSRNKQISSVYIPRNKTRFDVKPKNTKELPRTDDHAFQYTRAGNGRLISSHSSNHPGKTFKQLQVGDRIVATNAEGKREIYVVKRVEKTMYESPLVPKAGDLITSKTSFDPPASGKSTWAGLGEMLMQQNPNALIFNACIDIDTSRDKLLSGSEGMYFIIAEPERINAVPKAR